jgi:hypothetical protein
MSSQVRILPSALSPLSVSCDMVSPNHASACIDADSGTSTLCTEGLGIVRKEP